MISTGQIVAAATVTGIAVALAAAVMRWPPAALAALHCQGHRNGHPLAE